MAMIQDKKLGSLKYSFVHCSLLKTSLNSDYSVSISHSVEKIFPPKLLCYHIITLMSCELDNVASNARTTLKCKSPWQVKHK